MGESHISFHCVFLFGAQLSIIILIVLCYHSYPLFQWLLTGDEDDEEDEKLPSCMDYVMHFLTLFWKVIFACVPPTGKYNQNIVLKLATIVLEHNYDIE